MSEILITKQKENQRLKDQLLLIKAQLKMASKALQNIGQKEQLAKKNIINKFSSKKIEDEKFIINNKEVQNIKEKNTEHQLSTHSQKSKVTAKIERIGSEPGMNSLLKPLSVIDLPALMSKQVNLDNNHKDDRKL